MKSLFITLGILGVTTMIIYNLKNASPKEEKKQNDIVPATKIVTGHPITDHVINSAAAEVLKNISKR